MQGKRVYSTPDGRLLLTSGDFGIDIKNNGWYCCTPNGHVGNLQGHDVTEHDDGTITVSPSILVSDDTGELWHGYLEHGVWRQV